MAHVMIIDDDQDFADAAATVLRNAGHEVEVQLAIDAALESMEQQPPDLAILDVMFPEDDSAGFGLARTMHHYRESLKDVPILMLTAVNVKFPLGFSRLDIDGQWLPIADFLEKPVELDVLCSIVAGLLERSGKRDADPCCGGPR